MNQEIEDKLIEEFSLTQMKHVQSKKGVHVYEVKRGAESFFLKHFEKESDAKEIDCYKALSSTKIPIIKFYDYTENTILLENIRSTTRFREGIEEDFYNPTVAKSAGRWFKALHKITSENTSDFDFLDDQLGLFTSEDIMTCEQNYGKSHFFDTLRQNVDRLNDYLSCCVKAVIHDDFYYKNFFVDKESHELVMFDFNYMTKALRSQELDLIRRILKSRSARCEQAFLEAYGDYDELEYAIFSVHRHVSILTSSLNYEECPDWALESRQVLKEGRLNEVLLKTIMDLDTRIKTTVAINN